MVTVTQNVATYLWGTARLLRPALLRGTKILVMLLMAYQPNTVIPRLTKIIRSAITFVSRYVMLSGVSLLAVSNVNNPVGLVGLPYVMWSAHFFVTHIQTKKKTPGMARPFMFAALC